MSILLLPSIGTKGRGYEVTIVLHVFRSGVEWAHATAGDIQRSDREPTGIRSFATGARLVLQITSKLEALQPNEWSDTSVPFPSP